MAGQRPFALASRRTLGVMVAPIAAVATWLIAENVFDVAFDVEVMGRTQPEAMTASTVGVGSLTVSVLGWVVAGLCARFLPRPRAWWTGLAVAVYALSWVPVFVQTVDASAGDRIAILIVHSIVAVVLISMVAPTLPTRR